MPGDYTHLVVHVDDHIVTFREVEHWYWPLAIDPNDRSILLAIWVAIHPGDVEIVGDGRSRSDTCQRGNGYPISNHVAGAVLLASSLDAA